MAGYRIARAPALEGSALFSFFAAAEQETWPGGGRGERLNGDIPE